jgi:hypothetical protein
MRRLRWAILSLVLVAFPVVSQAEESKEASASCKALCFNYRQVVILERSLAAQQSCPNYISPLADPVVIRVRLAPELQQGLYVAVDDVLDIKINGNKVWEKILSVDGNPSVFKKDHLRPGCNTLAFEYMDTKPTDAYFMAQLGGVGFCAGENYCQTYREGQTFGTGVVARILAKGNPVLSGQVFKSRLESPAASGCRCQDP